MLLAAAAPKEAAAVAAWSLAADELRERETLFEGRAWRLVPINDRFDLVMTGVGKVNAAAGVLSVVDPSRHGAVLSVGVAGSLPSPSGEAALQVGQVVTATASVYADEGVETDAGFQPMSRLGFRLGPFSGESIPADSRVLAWLGLVADSRGPIATVSTCSGTDARAAAVQERTAAIAEAMEGAAVGHALARQHPGMPFGELRAISNRTGRREAQGWNLDLALARLSAVMQVLDAKLR